MKASGVWWDGKLLWDLVRSFNLLPSRLSNDNTVERISTPRLFMILFYSSSELQLHLIPRSLQRSLFREHWWRKWEIFFFSQFITTQVLRSPKRFWQWLPSALAVWFVWSWSESNQWSMINMENSHYNHSFLWETTVWLCTKPWVNKPQNRQLY